MHGNILNKDITSHIEIRMLPTPHPSWPPLLYITCRKYANHIYVFYASDSMQGYVSYHYSCIIYWGILCIRSCRWSPLEPLLSCPDHIFCKGHGLPQLVMNRNMFLKGWNSDTARPEKGMQFVLLTLLFKDTEDWQELVKKSCKWLNICRNGS